VAREPANKLPVKQSVKPKKKRAAPAAPVGGRWQPAVWQQAVLHGAEVLALLAAGLVAIIAVLGVAASWFSEAAAEPHLLPFAGTVLGLALAVSALLRAWLALRGWLAGRAAVLPALVAVCIAVGAGGFATHKEFRRELGSLRALVGGMREAERTTLAHQVFAAYRRADLAEMQRIIERAEVYLPTVREAAETYGIDPEVLVGVGATESSFYPRDSKDGGRGLFQITAPPKAAVDQVRKRLNAARLDPLNQRHNTFVAAATLRHYLKEMHDDLFLGLLAYNIGPRNGGLLSIMNQYGARDFITIQPYLKNLPRDYPIRVLTAALAYRLWSREGRLPRYEENDNAVHIQDIGIPGLKNAAGRV
jgi:hypothetical protein